MLLLGVNISVTSLHRIENNQRTVRDYEICALSVVLGIEVTDLLGPMTNKFKHPSLYLSVLFLHFYLVIVLLLSSDFYFFINLSIFYLLFNT